MGMSARLQRLKEITQKQMDAAGEPFTILAFRMGTPFKESTLTKYRLDGKYLRIFQRSNKVGNETLFSLVGERDEAPSPRMLRKQRLEGLEADSKLEERQRKMLEQQLVTGGVYPQGDPLTITEPTQ